MTKNDETPTVDITALFVDIPETSAENEYDPIVAALLTAGESKGYPLTSPTADHKRELRRFQDAATRADRTARRVSSEVKGENTTTIVRLRPKVTKRTAAEIAAADADADAPEISE